MTANLFRETAKGLRKFSCAFSGNGVINFTSLGVKRGLSSCVKRPEILEVAIPDQVSLDLQKITCDLIAAQKYTLMIPPKPEITGVVSDQIRDYCRLNFTQAIDAMAVFKESSGVVAVHFSNLKQKSDRWPSIDFAEDEYFWAVAPMKNLAQQTLQPLVPAIITNCAFMDMAGYKMHKFSEVKNLQNPVSPIFHDQGISYTQLPHKDDLNDRGIAAVSIDVIKGGGATKTYIITADEIVASLSQSSRDILSKKMFFFNPGAKFGPADTGMDPEKLSNFAIIDEKEGRLVVNFDTDNRDCFFVRPASGIAQKEAEKAIVELSTNLVQLMMSANGVALKEGENLIFKHEIHGRLAYEKESRQILGMAYDQKPKTALDAVDASVFKGAEARFK